MRIFNKNIKLPRFVKTNNVNQAFQEMGDRSTLQEPSRFKKSLANLSKISGGFSKKQQSLPTDDVHTTKLSETSQSNNSNVTEELNIQQPIECVDKTVAIHNLFSKHRGEVVKNYLLNKNKCSYNLFDNTFNLLDNNIEDLDNFEQSFHKLQDSFMQINTLIMQEISSLESSIANLDKHSIKLSNGTEVHPPQLIINKNKLKSLLDLQTKINNADDQLFHRVIAVKPQESTDTEKPIFEDIQQIILNTRYDFSDSSSAVPSEINDKFIEIARHDDSIDAKVTEFLQNNIPDTVLKKNNIIKIAPFFTVDEDLKSNLDNAIMYNEVAKDILQSMIESPQNYTHEEIQKAQANVKKTGEDVDKVLFEYQSSNSTLNPDIDVTIFSKEHITPENELQVIPYFANDPIPTDISSNNKKYFINIKLPKISTSLKEEHQLTSNKTAVINIKASIFSNLPSAHKKLAIESAQSKEVNIEKQEWIVPDDDSDLDDDDYLLLNNITNVDEEKLEAIIDISHKVDPFSTIDQASKKSFTEIEEEEILAKKEEPIVNNKTKIGQDGIEEVDISDIPKTMHFSILSRKTIEDIKIPNKTLSSPSNSISDSVKYGFRHPDLEIKTVFGRLPANAFSSPAEYNKYMANFKSKFNNLSKGIY